VKSLAHIPLALHDPFFNVNVTAFPYAIRVIEFTIRQDRGILQKCYGLKNRTTQHDRISDGKRDQFFGSMKVAKLTKRIQNTDSLNNCALDIGKAIFSV